MKRDAHYYGILALSRACGFKKESALTLAYASQYVDDAKINLIHFQDPDKGKGSTENQPFGGIIYDVVDDKEVFINMATCHSYFWIKTFNYEAMVSNTCAFHFVPGCQGENFTKKLRCKEESPVILKILNEALQEDSLIKLGMVLHTYADTFSHQGFSGMLSKVNDIKECEERSGLYRSLGSNLIHLFKRLGQKRYEELFDRIVPAYGHGQALDFPDLPYLVWSYQYDYSDEFNGCYKEVEIDNKDRYRRAFTKIRDHLQHFLLLYPQHFDNDVKFADFDQLMETLVLEADDNKREEAWLSFLFDHHLFDKQEKKRIIYKSNQWLKEAFSNYTTERFAGREVEGALLGKNFIDSDWYHFYRAVKWYKDRFFSYCSEFEVDIPH